MEQVRFQKPTQSVRGFAVIHVLALAVVIVAALSALLSGSGFNMTGMSATNTANLLNSQAQYIRQQILSCASNYPTGSNGTAFRPAYPAGATAVAVSSLTCPGTGAALWLGTDGNFMPQPITGFGSWQYVNDATSMRLVIVATSAAYSAGISQAVTQIGTEALASGGTTLTVTLSL